MTAGSQSQRAGQGATQIQVTGNYIVQHGVTEERAQEIAEDTARQVVAEYSTEARELIEARITELDQRVINTLGSSGELDAFADPAFARAYRKAQEGAAASERELDYDMLAALIAKRVKRPRDRPLIAGIDRAIEVMDRVDADALRGLTAAYAFQTWTPVTGSISEGIAVLDGIFERVIDGALPEGSAWLDHLDILDAVRVGTRGLGGMKTVEQYYGDALDGYVAPGVESPGPEFVGGELPGVRWGDSVVDHELRPGFRRLRAISKAQFEKQQREVSNDSSFSETVIAQAVAVFGLGQQDEKAREALRFRIREALHLGPMADWWDRNTEFSFQLTSVGQALARANCFRMDPGGYLPRDE